MSCECGGDAIGAIFVSRRRAPEEPEPGDRQFSRGVIEDAPSVTTCDTEVEEGAAEQLVCPLLDSSLLRAPLGRTGFSSPQDLRESAEVSDVPLRQGPQDFGQQEKRLPRDGRARDHWI